jgi:hypothetical protein
MEKGRAINKRLEVMKKHFYRMINKKINNRIKINILIGRIDSITIKMKIDTNLMGESTIKNLKWPNICSLSEFLVY